jgi:hypothetical protein
MAEGYPLLLALAPVGMPPSYLNWVRFAADSLQTRSPRSLYRVLCCALLGWEIGAPGIRSAQSDLARLGPNFGGYPQGRLRL